MFRKLFASCLHRPVPRPSCKLMLETLEDRLTPTATPISLATPAPSPPPSFTQAAVALYFDGASLLVAELGGTYRQNFASANASIAYYSPYAEPFSLYFVWAGEAAMAQALQALHSSPSGLPTLASLGLSL